MIDIVERLRNANDALLMVGNDYSDVLLDSANEIESLRKVQRITAEALANEEEEVSALRAEISELRKAQGDPVGFVQPVNEDNDMWIENLPVGTALYTSAPSIPEGWQLVRTDVLEDIFDNYIPSSIELDVRNLLTAPKPD